MIEDIEVLHDLAGGIFGYGLEKYSADGHDMKKRLF